MDRQTQRQNIRNIDSSACQADFYLTPNALPAGRPTPACTTGVAPAAFPFSSPTGCVPPLAPLPLSPTALFVGNDLQTAFCPTAVGYSSTGTIVFSVTAYDQQQPVYFQTLTNITTQQLNYLYDSLPSSSGAIITAALAGNTATVKNLTKLSDSQVIELVPQIQDAKFIVDNLAVLKARNSLLCQGFNSYQYASCTASAFFGASALVPPELAYSPTAFSATGEFLVPYTLKSTTGDQAAFTALNIPGLTAATQLANELALASANKQLACVFANDEQTAGCCTAYANNLGYHNCVPNDILPVLPSLPLRVGSTAIAAESIFTATSKSEANSLAADLALSLLNCYFPNEDTATGCSDNLVASPYPVTFSANNAAWSSTANSLYVPYRQVYEVPLNTRVYFSGGTIPAGFTAEQLYYATSITAYSSGIQLKLSGATASHIQYETDTITFLNFTDSGSNATVTALKSSSPGRYAYILRGEILQTDVSASTTSANQLAANILPTYLDCYWSNDAQSATCADASITGINGVGYIIPASPSASRVYNVTIPAGSIISFISKDDANASASAAAELTLDCSYCNVRVDPVCTPTAGSLYPDEDLPLSPSAFIPNCWSIDATPGAPPGVICDTDAAAAQNLAISLGNISLRDQKAEATNCCYESAPVYNTVFCGPGAVYSSSSETGSLNSQDSFFLPSGTIVICATGEAPPPPVNRFLYSDIWLTNSAAGFCCTGSTGIENCIPANYGEYYLGDLWGDATQAFSTNAGVVKFYSTSGALYPIDFSSAGVQGFTAGYVVQSTTGNVNYRTVISEAGIPTSDTRYINACPTCNPELFEYSVYISHYSPTAADALTYAVNYSLCQNYSAAPSTTVWSTSPSAFVSSDFASSASWYADACASTPLNIASSTGYAVVLLSTTAASGETKYASFNTPAYSRPSAIIPTAYPGSSAYSVTGCYVPYSGASGIFAAVQNIFCGGPNTVSETLYTDSPIAFDLNDNFTDNKWYEASCGLPSFTPNSGSAYVIGKYIPGSGNVYLVFGASGSNQVTSGSTMSSACVGVYPYFVYPSVNICDTTTTGLTLYTNLSNAFTTNGADPVYFYTEPYNAGATYAAPLGTYLTWVSNTLSSYSRITSTTTNLFESAISCDNTLVPITVYYSNTAAADVCSFPWALNASGTTGYNSNVKTLYAKPYVFYPGGPTAAVFYTAANTGPSYVFNNGSTGAVTYIAPFNNCTNLNTYYREYINGGTGSTGLKTFNTALHYAAPFKQTAASSTDNLWEQEDKQFGASFGGTNYPAYSYETLRIAGPSATATCQSKALYSDVVDVFLPFSAYSSSTANLAAGATSYKKFYSSKRMLFNDGVLVPIGTCSYNSSNTITATSDRLGAVFPGCLLQTSPTGYINSNAYVQSIDIDTGTISLTGASSVFATGFSTLASPINFSVVGYTVEVDNYVDNATYLMSVTAAADLNYGKWKIKSPANLDTLVLSSNQGKLYSETAAELYPALGGTSLKQGDVLIIKLDDGNIAYKVINSFNNSQEAVFSSNIVSSATAYFLGATSAAASDNSATATFSQVVSGLTAGVSLAEISRTFSNINWKKGYTGYYRNIKWNNIDGGSVIVPVPYSVFSETENNRINLKLTKKGTVIKSTDLSYFDNLITFDESNLGSFPGDGTNASLYASSEDGFIYAVCPSGGAGGSGSIVRFDTSGQNFIEVVDFGSAASGISGYAPVGGLVKGDQDYLYGVCSRGDSGDVGAIYYMPLYANSYLRAGTPGTTGVSNDPLTLGEVYGLATDSQYIYFSDQYFHTIRKVGLTAGTTGAIVAGSPTQTGLINSSVGSNVRFQRPSGMAATGGFLYVADAANNVIRKVNATTGETVTYCGSSVGASGTVAGSSSAGRFNYPIDVCTGFNSGTASVFVADYLNNAIRAVTIAGSNTGWIYNYANTSVGTAGLAPVTTGTKAAARFNAPAGIAYDNNPSSTGYGNLYVADTFNHRIVMLKQGGVSTAGLAVHMAGGTGGLFDSGYANGASGVARFTFPSAITVLSTGELLVGDVATVRRVSVTGYVSLVAGPTSGVTGYVNGTKDNSRFDTIKRIIVDPSDASENKFIISEVGSNYDLRTLWFQYSAPLQKLATFSSASAAPKNPNTGLVWKASNSSFYGTSVLGGTNGAIPGSTTYFGTVYRCSTTGSISRILDFSNTGGTTPGRYPGALTLGSDGYLYGTTKYGNSADKGVVFKVDAPATGGASTYQTLIQFTGSTSASDSSRGQYPKGNVVFDSSNNYIYGSAEGGVNNGGILFRSGTATASPGLTGTIFDFPSTTNLLQIGKNPSPFIAWGPGGYIYGSFLEGNANTYTTGTFKCTTAGAFTVLNINSGGADVVPSNIIYDSVSTSFYGIGANVNAGPFSSSQTAIPASVTAYVHAARAYSLTETEVFIKLTEGATSATPVVNAMTTSNYSGVNAYVTFQDSITVPLLDTTCAYCVTGGTPIKFTGTTGPVAVSTTAYILKAANSSNPNFTTGVSLVVSMTAGGATAAISGSLTGTSTATQMVLYGKIGNSPTGPTANYITSVAGLNVSLNEPVIAVANSSFTFNRNLSGLTAYRQNADAPFICSSDACDKLQPGHFLYNADTTAVQAVVTSNSGGTITYKSVPLADNFFGTSTLDFGAYKANRVYVLGKFAAQLWTDNNKANSVTGLYSATSVTGSNYSTSASYSSFIYKDQTEIYHRAILIPGFGTGNTAQSQNAITFVSTRYDFPVFYSPSYPGGTAPENYYDGAPKLTGNTGIYCSGGSYYQEAVIKDCNNTVTATAWIAVTPISSGNILANCETGSGTAYVYLTELNTLQSLYYWADTCSGTGGSPLQPINKIDNLAYITTDFSTGYYFTDGVRSSGYASAYTYPCVPSAPSMSYVSTLEAQPMVYGQEDMFSFSFADAVGSSAGCDVYTEQQSDADRIAQELVNSFVRCFYVNELQSFTVCPATGGNPEANIKLNDGIVEPGTFVSMISQDDANQIAESVAKSLLVCVTPDQVGGGPNGPSNLSYASMSRAYMRRIKICNPDTGESEDVWVFKNGAEFISSTDPDEDDVPVYFAAYRESKGPPPSSTDTSQRRNYALQKPV